MESQFYVEVKAPTNWEVQPVASGVQPPWDVKLHAREPAIVIWGFESSQPQGPVERV